MLLLCYVVVLLNTANMQPGQTNSGLLMELCILGAATHISPENGEIINTLWWPDGPPESHFNHHILNIRENITHFYFLCVIIITNIIIIIVIIIVFIIIIIIIWLHQGN